MRRFFLTLLTTTIALLAVMVGVGWYLLHDDAFLKSRLNAFMLANTGRTLTVESELRLELGRRLVVNAGDVRLQNASWAEEPYMVQAGRLRAVLDLPSLFEDTVIIHQLEIDDCAIDLVQTETNAANWDDLMALAGDDETGDESKPGEPLPVVFRDNRVRNCKLRHQTPGRDEPLLLEVDTLDLELSDDVRWQGSGRGRLNGEKLTLSGWLEPAGVFINGGALRHNLDLEIGAISLKSEGGLQDVYTGQGADLRLHFRGPEIEQVLAYFDLPPASTGEFDFRLTLDARGEMTTLDLDGDLGSLQAGLQGEVDQLAPPTRGQVRGKVKGPDLALLGSILGVEGLPAEPYTLDADLGFEAGLMQFSYLELLLPDDRLSVTGRLGSDGAMSGTDLDFAASSGDPGRWAATLGRPVRQIGAATLTGRLLSDDQGQGTLRARIEYAGNALTVVGGLGPLAGPLQPALDIEFYSTDLGTLQPLLDEVRLPRTPLSLRGHLAKPAEFVLLEGVDVLSDGHSLAFTGKFNPEAPYVGSTADVQLSSANASKLGLLLGREGLPVTPLKLSARLSRPDQRIRFEDVVLELDGHRARLDGNFDPDKKLANSEFDVNLDSPDVGALGRLFGHEGLPGEPLSLSGSLKSEGKGLRFETRQGELGAIRLSAEGRVADLARPSGIDARFDVRLPSLRLLQFLVEETELPDLPFSARGAMHNEKERVRLEDVRWTLGDTTGVIDGDWSTDQRIAASIDVSGSDASQLQSWIGMPLPAEPFALRTQVSGDAEATKFTDLAAEFGASRAGGELTVTLAEPVRISGRVHAPLIDLRGLREEEEGRAEGEAGPAAAGQDSSYVFDDKPLTRIDDYGVDLDLDFTAERIDLGNTTAHDVVLGVRLGKNRLELEPFMVTGAGSGKLRGRAVFDDRGDTPALDAELFAENLRLGLAAGPNQDISTYPPIDIALSVQGQGFTQREMASSLDGKLRVYLGPGLIASAGVDLFFSDFLTELFEALNPLAESSEYTRVDCAVLGADIADGLVNVDPAVFHTEEFTVFNKGTVDLGSEKINLSFTTKPRKGLGITPGTVINTLIKVGGTLKKPAVELDPQGALVAGTAAIATAGLSIVARGFSDRFLASKDPCGDARTELEERDR